MARKGKVVIEYAQLWPREVYNIKKGRGVLPSLSRALHNKVGVYVLYRDDQPYYIGKTKGSLFKRIRDHALNQRDGKYLFWNHFSVFVTEPEYIDVIEAVLIKAFPSAGNNSKPSIERLHLPDDLAKHLKDIDATAASTRV